MKLVSELSLKQKDLIVEALKEDGFKNVIASDSTISFHEGDKVKREYVIMSTDMTNSEDLGIRMDFDYDKFLDKIIFIKVAIVYL